MISKLDGEVAHVQREIEARRRYIDDQAALIDVLEHDGHDVLEQRKALAKARSDLAVRIARQFRLLEQIANDDPPVHGGDLMEERRRVERTNADEIAYISGDGASLRCRVFNISDKGAAIELPTKRYIRSVFRLMLEKDRIVRDCRLVWSSGNRVGVVFVDESSEEGAP
jgi:hypothetical protein